MNISGGYIFKSRTDMARVTVLPIALQLRETMMAHPLLKVAIVAATAVAAAAAAAANDGIVAPSLFFCHHPFQFLIITN